jgi:hypothetical protein
MKVTMRAVGALDAGFLADATHPLMGARRHVSRLPGLAALESPGIHVLTPAEEVAEEGNLGVRRR